MEPSNINIWTGSAALTINLNGVDLINSFVFIFRAVGTYGAINFQPDTIITNNYQNYN
jgi:hypothetical protein